MTKKVMTKKVMTTKQLRRQAAAYRAWKKGRNHPHTLVP